MPVTTNTRKLAALLGASGAGIGTDGLLQAAAVDANIATQAELDASAFDDDAIQANLAILAIRQAADHNDVKYSLQDRIIDDYYDASGIDTSASTNEILTSGSYAIPAVVTYTVHTFPTGATNFVVTGSSQIDVLMIGGGGSGGGLAGGGGGGAGGVLYKLNAFNLSAGTYAITVAGGGPATTATTAGMSGGNTTFNGARAVGGGGGALRTAAGQIDNHGPPPTITGGGQGGSGAGQSFYSSTAYGTVDNHIGTNVGMTYAGNDGGTSGLASTGGGGGGAGTAGSPAASASGGDGGDGIQNDYQTGSNQGYAGGGGGGEDNGSNNGDGGAYGGGDAGHGSSPTAAPEAGSTPGSGGGGGSTAGQVGGAGAAGTVIVRFVAGGFDSATGGTITSYGNTYVDLTLQSLDTEAEVQPTKADMVMLVEDAGSAVGAVQTHIKGWISRDSGTTFTQGTLVDEGDWGTNKRILAFHDLDISGQPADKTMCYKITTHSQSAVYNTKIHATSIGWK